MPIRAVASLTETDAISQLIEQGAYRQALSQLLGQLGSDLGEYCLAMLDQQSLAERAVIATLADIYAAMPTLGDEPLRPWMFACARRTCLALYAESGGAARSKRRLSPAESMRVVLQQLDADERDAGLLRYLARLDYWQIASICGTDEASTRRKAGKALLRLRQAMLDGQLQTPTARHSSGARE